MKKLKDFDKMSKKCRFNSQENKRHKNENCSLIKSELLMDITRLVNSLTTIFIKKHSLFIFHFDFQNLFLSTIYSNTSS